MSEPPLGLTEALADRYRLERELGQGGMATVYLAHDLRHDRQVAIKVLRPELAAVIGAERFLSEIKTTANLQHPHILPLFDSGVTDRLTVGPSDRLSESFLFYVMPFVEGESLRDRLNREKQLPISDAVRIATEVASALDYAHRHNVIHRDIKPENILLHDGRALVADFGIALAASKAGGTRMTETGLSLGTPHYMSPEQAMGEREITPRSDVYALGAMTYEMLVGEPPFTGPTAQAIVAKVLSAVPVPPTELRKTIPPQVEDAILTALEKLPADRWSSAAEFAAGLQGGPGLGGTHPPRRPSPTAVQAGVQWRQRAIALGLGGLALGATAMWVARPSVAAPTVQSFLDIGDAIEAGIQMSPDGSTIAFLRPDSSGRTRLFLRSLAELEAKAVSGTEGLITVFFSPDGKRLGVYDGVRLRIGELTGPYETVVARVNWDLRSPSWGPDGFIYFTDRTGAAARVNIQSGAIEILATLDASRGFYGRYDVLPGGRGLLLTMLGQHGNEIDVLDLASRKVSTLAKGQSPHYASGYIIFAAPDGSLMAQPFDERHLAVTGPARPLGAHVPIFTFGAATFSVSRHGELVYQSINQSSSVAGQVLVWISRAGTQRDLGAPPSDLQAVAASPDGRRVAVESQAARLPAGGQLVVMGLDDSLPTPLLFDGLGRYPTWTPDGKRIAFSRLLGDERDLFWQPADGSGREEPIFKRPGSQWEITFTPDQRWIVYREGDASRNDTLSLRYRALGPAADSGDRAFPHLRGNDPRSPTLSPDGHLLAFVSDEAGPPQVFVRPFPPDSAGAVWQVTTDGGTEPRWALGGREIYYRLGGAFWAAAVNTRPTFRVVSRRRLFAAPGVFALPWHPQYGVLPDGSIVGTRSATGGSSARMILVQGWPALLAMAPRD
jgi:serine/threonine-protein kinase